MAILVGVLTNKFAPVPEVKNDTSCCSCAEVSDDAEANAPAEEGVACTGDASSVGAAASMFNIPLKVAAVTEDFDLLSNSLVSNVEFEILGGGNGRASSIAKSKLVLPSNGMPGMHTVFGAIGDSDAAVDAEPGILSFELAMKRHEIERDGVSIDIRPILCSNGWPARSWPDPTVKAHVAVDAAKLPKFVPPLGPNPSKDHGTIDVNAELCKNWSIEAVHQVPDGESSRGSQSVTISADRENGPKIKYEKTFEKDHSIGSSISLPAAELELSYSGTFGSLAVSGEFDAPSRLGSLDVSAPLPGDAGDLSLKLSSDGRKPLNVSASWRVEF